MPDLTIEYRWICQDWFDWCSVPTMDDRELHGMSEPACQWNQEYDGGEPIDGKCPLCGGHVTSYAIGV